MMNDAEALPESKSNIVGCFEEIPGLDWIYSGWMLPQKSRWRWRAALGWMLHRAPYTINRLGTGRLTGRKILHRSFNLGSYGMGSPGFLGLQLAASASYPQEWIVLALWSAGNWLLLDGHWVEASPNQYHVQKPLYSNFSGMEHWDEFSDKVVGAVIVDAVIRDNESLIDLRQDSVTHRLELPTDISRLAKHGSLKERTWYSQESHRDAWVFSRNGDLWL